MSKEITIEEARNQKEVKVPMFQTKYMIFTRYDNKSDWYSGCMLYSDQQAAINEIRRSYSTAYDAKIISFELPF